MERRSGENKNIAVSAFLLFTFGIALFCFLLPANLSEKDPENTVSLSAHFDYKATTAPNALHPSGGTVPVGETMIKKITTGIPVDWTISLTAADEVRAVGTYEAVVAIKAESLWEKEFPLVKKTSFEKVGTSLVLLEEKSTVDLEKLNAFITQVEEETGISPSKYSIEIIPRLDGFIQSAGVERDMPHQEPLIFQYGFDSITLASDKTSTLDIEFGGTPSIPNAVNLGALSISIQSARLISVLLFLITLATLLAMNRPIWVKRKRAPNDVITKKYGSRLIEIDPRQGEWMDLPVLHLTSMKSLIRIADEKELPIFFYKQQEEKGTYFILDGHFHYKYEIVETNSAINNREWVKAYAEQ
ncbi:hypothetical protein HNO89_000575 [Sporosarcina luteola]|nr:hypothetical protein [Sporosarcina luteola]